MKFSKGKTSGREECHRNMQGPGDWRIMLMDSKLNMNQPYALTAKQAIASCTALRECCQEFKGLECSIQHW